MVVQKVEQSGMEWTETRTTHAADILVRYASGYREDSMRRIAPQNTHRRTDAQAHRRTGAQTHTDAQTHTQCFTINTGLLTSPTGTGPVPGTTTIVSESAVL